MRNVMDIMNSAGDYYAKASFVQKRKITEIFFSNITVDNKKSLTVEVKPIFLPLFERKNSSGALFSDYFEHATNILNEMPYRQKVGLFKFYFGVMRDSSGVNDKLTKKQVTYYQLDELC